MWWVDYVLISGGGLLVPPVTTLAVKLQQSLILSGGAAAKLHTLLPLPIPWLPSCSFLCSSIYGMNASRTYHIKTLVLLMFPGHALNGILDRGCPPPAASGMDGRAFETICAPHYSSLQHMVRISSFSHSSFLPSKTASPSLT